MMPLAQVTDPAEALGNGLATNPLAYGLALALLAIAYLFRELRAADKLARDEAKTASEAHMKTMEKIVPLAEKLTDGVVTMERVVDKLTTVTQ